MRNKTQTHTRRSCVCARVQGTRAGPVCYISENRNGPTAGRPLSLSLISMCFFHLSLFFSLAWHFSSVSLSTISIRPCIILLYIYITPRVHRTNPVPMRHARTHNNDDICIILHYKIAHLWATRSDCQFFFISNQSCTYCISVMGII